MKGKLRIAVMAGAAYLVVFAGTGTTAAKSKPYVYSYPSSCDQVWSAVKTVLADKDHYNLHNSDDAQMSAGYQPKHEIHTSITPLLTQKENQVKLTVSGSGCDMEVVSSYSGMTHDDQSDFKKRVDSALAKAAAPDASPAKPAASDATAPK